ncbi:hypothetical protein [Tenacibaculum sp.]|uniref:hypothetical protein n=1 Tax=Tenacibaculum sp. TaxID=1906242 RepID=UPI003AA893B2
MKQNKETLRQFFETGDKPTQQQYADLIDSYIDAKQPEGEANRRFVIDETGEVSVATEQPIPEYTLSPISGTNMVDLLKDGVSVSQIDLTPYLDNTNLARLVSGTVDANGLATFTRDDNSTFTVDLSNLKDNPNLQMVTDNGKVTTHDIVVTKPDSGNIAFTADSPNKKAFILPQSLDILDQENKILTSYKESSLKIATSTNTKAFVLKYPSDEVINGGTGFKVLNFPHKSGTVAVAEEIPQYQAGTNITIDNTDPLQPIINATGGSGGATDLSYDTATRTVASSTGTDAVIPLANATNAGLQKANFYEEGAFIPTLVDTGSGATYSATGVLGSYARIGNSVTIQIRFTSISTVGTPSAALSIEGLPFPLASGSGGSLSMSQFRGHNKTLAEINALHPSIQNSRILFYILDSDSAFSNVEFSGASRIDVSGTYITDVYTL